MTSPLQHRGRENSVKVGISSIDEAPRRKNIRVSYTGKEEDDEDKSEDTVKKLTSSAF